MELALSTVAAFFQTGAASGQAAAPVQAVLSQAGRAPAPGLRPARSPRAAQSGTGGFQLDLSGAEDALDAQFTRPGRVA